MRGRPSKLWGPFQTSALQSFILTFCREKPRTCYACYHRYDQLESKYDKARLLAISMTRMKTQLRQLVADGDLQLTETPARSGPSRLAVAYVTTGKGAVKLKQLDVLRSSEA